MAKKKSRRRRARRSGGSFPFAKRRFRRRSSGRSRRALGGFIDTSLLTGGAAGLAGYLGLSFALTKVPPGWVDSDAKRIGFKVGASLAAAFLMRKMGLSRFAGGVAIGGLIAAGVDVARVNNWVPGLSGLGDFGIDGTDALAFIGGTSIAQLPGSVGDDMSGLGDMGEVGEDEDLVIVQEQ